MANAYMDDRDVFFWYKYNDNITGTATEKGLVADYMRAINSYNNAVTDVQNLEGVDIYNMKIWLKEAKQDYESAVGKPRTTLNTLMTKQAKVAQRERQLKTLNIELKDAKVKLTDSKKKYDIACRKLETFRTAHGIPKKSYYRESYY